MPWKNEIDRLVSRAVVDAAKGSKVDAERAVRALHDLLALDPDRAESHFHVGVADELLADKLAPQEDDEAADEQEDGKTTDEPTLELPESPGDGARWRHLGCLDACARRGKRERVREMMEESDFEDSLERPEGRVALRAVGRMLLRDGEDQRIFDYYKRHLAAVDDEGSKRDAEFLLEEALRRADRYERGERNEDEALARLDRAAGFAESAGLDPRASAKVDRKMGRVHQLGERWEDAARCYQRALDSLPEEDPYRSVLVGDLALATLGVRGTLDLLPEADREQRDEARQILESEREQGEGRSYNAIYTLGMLRYEEGDHEGAAEAFSEADELMRQNRAKARIVHARSRFFLGHCLIELGADDDELAQAQKYIQRDAGASNLPPEIKEPVFDALLEVVPDARIPGRGRGRDRERGRDRDRGRERGRGRRGRGRGRGEPALDALAAAREALAEDPHRTLELVDQVFKSRPDFETWYGAYRARLDALLALEAGEEALRTFDRFRAKLYKAEALDRIETLLLEESGPAQQLLDGAEYRIELVDLYEVMQDRDDAFIENCVEAARALLERGKDGDAARARALLREAGRRDEDAVADDLAKAEKAVGDNDPDPAGDETREQIKSFEEPVRILLIGGDEGRRPHLAAFESLAGDIGFEGSWIFTGARPPARAMQEIEDSAQDTDAILLHPRADAELREEVLKLAEELDIPVREAPWMGAGGVEREVLCTLKTCIVEE